MTCSLLDDAQAARILRGGGVLILGTDTIPGLHARTDNPEALMRLAAAKGRPQGKPLLVLADSLEQAATLCAPLSRNQMHICRSFWPGPFTFILPARQGLMSILTDAAAGTVAIRVPAPASLRRLIYLVGQPLASTSVNDAGAEPLLDPAAAAAAFSDRIDGWWQPPTAERADAASAVASALVDLMPSPPVVLREGPRRFTDPTADGLIS